MDGQLFRHLNIRTDLVIEFMAVFSRFEYALKSAGFAYGGSKIVNPAWDKFANEIHHQFEQIDDEPLRKSVKFLLEKPPRKQVLIDDKLSFKEQIIDKQQCTTQQSLKMIRTVRNNLFHGGKYCIGEENEDGRNQQLVESSLKVLEHCCQLDKEVLASYKR